MQAIEPRTLHFRSATTQFVAEAIACWVVVVGRDAHWAQSTAGWWLSWLTAPAARPPRTTPSTASGCHGRSSRPSQSHAGDSRRSDAGPDGPTNPPPRHTRDRRIRPASATNRGSPSTLHPTRTSDASEATNPDNESPEQAYQSPIDRMTHPRHHVSEMDTHFHEFTSRPRLTAATACLFVSLPRTAVGASSRCSMLLSTRSCPLSRSALGATVDARGTSR